MMTGEMGALALVPLLLFWGLVLGYNSGNLDIATRLISIATATASVDGRALCVCLMIHVLIPLGVVLCRVLSILGYRVGI